MTVKLAYTELSLRNLDLYLSRPRPLRAGTSQALYVLEQEVARLSTNADAMAAWMNGIDDILGCEFEIDKPSTSGKMGYRCRVCKFYSNAPVRGSASPCKEKVRAAREVVRQS